LSMYSSDK